MLTREHAIVELNFSSRKVEPDRLTSRTHRHYIGYAQEMLRIYREAAGRRRRDIHRDIELIFSDDPSYHPRRVESFCKLLDDAATYERDHDRHCAKLRSAVFLAAGTKHPLCSQSQGLFDHTEQDVKGEIAASYQRPWDAIEDRLFDDVLCFNRMKAFDVSAFPDARALLSRYNVAQFQVALFDASQMRIHATSHLKHILRFAKLAELMHTIFAKKNGTFVVVLDGPASVIEQTRRYGTCMAKFLPGLLSCDGWKMEADIQRGHLGMFELTLSGEDGLHSPTPAPEEFDSDVERKFAEKWGCAPRDGWTLEREGEPLVEGQHVFFPDFVFRHESGKVVFAEIVGYWTPQYLSQKRLTLERFQDRSLLLMLPEAIAAKFSDLPFPVVPYKSRLKLEPVIQVLSEMK